MKTLQVVLVKKKNKAYIFDYSKNGIEKSKK